MPAFRVIIIGGGLSGALLANGLINNEVDVTVYERDKEETKREGYQIRLGEPSLSGFRACLPPAHVATIEQKFGVSANGERTQKPYTAPCIYSPSFKVLLDLGKLPTYSISTAISRIVLRNFLVDPVKQKGRIEFNKPFSHYSIIEDKESGDKVRVHFSDGSTDVCDVLVGADGSASKINHQLGLDNILEIKSHFTFVCKGSLPPKRVDQLPTRLQQGPILVFHKGITLYYALYMPPQAGSKNKLNVLDYDHTEASFYWSLVVPKANFNYESAKDIPDCMQLCLSAVKDWAPEFTAMLSVGIEDSDGSGVTAIPLRASTKPSSTWREDVRRQSGDRFNPRGHPRVWLIGDSMHAMQPNRGMGGNQAMFDCTEILAPLIELDRMSKLGSSPSPEEVRAALGRYEGPMIERGFKWVEKSGGISVPKVDLQSGLIGLSVMVARIAILPVIGLLVSFFHGLKALFK